MKDILTSTSLKDKEPTICGRCGNWISGIYIIRDKNPLCIDCNNELVDEECESGTHFSMEAD
jgi:hypothetical protein